MSIIQPHMQAWKLLIEYEGTRYGGWQKQPHTRTVQGELIRAAETYLNSKVELGGSGRTDAGVHALGQVAHLKTNSRGKQPAAHHLRMGLNDLLPPDINVLEVSNAPARFHARHDAMARYYLYQISTRRTAFAKPYVWWVKDRLNQEAMRRAAELVVGQHDFRSFCESPKAPASTIVHVHESRLYASGSLLLFRIGASHFLWKMVRRIVGALVEVGRGTLTVEDFRQLFESESREVAAWTAPPSGLFLERVVYRGQSAPQEEWAAFPVP